MLIVLDETVAARDLTDGSIDCPSCSGGRLRPWGYARARTLRGLAGARRQVRPRRARCPGCAITHVLLPADIPPRHADTNEVVVTALLASHARIGHRSIAAKLGVPVDTVRSWLSRVSGRAEWLRTTATAWAYRYDPMAPPISPEDSPLGDALSALGQAVSATRRTLGSKAAPSQLIGLITAGRLLAPLPPARAG